MQYRKFCKDDRPVSILGFGTMRLPLNGSDPGDVDLLQSTAMIRLAIDRGVNYIDTAYGYHNGKSESTVGQALREGYRARVQLATKLPHWAVESARDMDRIFEAQLTRLEVDRIDCYLLHALSHDAWQKLKGLRVLEWAEQRIKSGQIDHLGFSFHDGPEIFRRIVDEYPWDFCQIQYNYMDTESQAGTSGLEYAFSKGLPVIVMEPLRGGSLADPPENVRAIFKQGHPGRSPAEWALQWAWSQPGVLTVLSGMSSMRQVEENLDAAERSKALSIPDRETVTRAKAAFMGIQAIGCTRCGYCLPCPYGVNIPENFTLYNEAERYKNFSGPRWQYSHRLKEQERAGFCTHCRRCMDKCPQHLPIPDLMDQVHQGLGGNG